MFVRGGLLGDDRRRVARDIFFRAVSKVLAVGAPKAVFVILGFLIVAYWWYYKFLVLSDFVQEVVERDHLRSWDCFLDSDVQSVYDVDLEFFIGLGAVWDSSERGAFFRVRCSPVLFVPWRRSRVGCCA